jgi:lipoprotein-anchoring transpeptidase ErfK/SrfK
MLFLTACGSLTPKGQAAQGEKARLDTAIQNAAKIGVPASLLNPIRQQEARIAGNLSPLGLFGDHNSDGAYTNAITSYQVLEGNVASAVAQAKQTARFQAHQDIQSFDALLQQRQNQGFDNEIPGYQARMNQVQQQYADGQTPNDFYKVSEYARQQTQALQLMWPTYQQLQALQTSITNMQNASLDTTLGQQEYNADLAAFRAASMPDDYTQLSTTLSTQIDQLAADQVAAIPAIGKAMLDQYQAQIGQAQTYGVDVTQYQQQLTQDQQDLKNAQTLQQYLDLSAKIRSQMSSMQTVLIQGKANYDLGQLKALIGQTDYSNDYEYQDGTDGYGDQLSYYQNAQSTDDYQSVDDQVQILLSNLHALLTNMSDQTAHDQAHATDLQLMKQYSLMSGKVVVVSLTEQTMRLYQDGQLVNTIPVVTGQEAAPTPAGLWHVFYKGTNLTFKSDEPPNSPLWYPPTPINYGMEYHSGGFFLHDATWRSYFGPGANLPHDDYTSGQYSDTGSHGCINMTLSNTAWLYNFVDINTPVLVY